MFGELCARMFIRQAPPNEVKYAHAYHASDTNKSKRDSDRTENGARESCNLWNDKYGAG